MRRPALIVSDLDGTLLQPNTAAFEPRVLDVVKRLLDAGIPFMPASGRQYPSVRQMFGHLAERLSFVCENGVVAYVDGNLIHRATLDYNLGREIVRSIQSRNGCETMVSGLQTYYISSESTSFLRYLEDNCGFAVTCTDDLENIGEPYGKISAFYPDGIGDDLRFWLERFSGKCTVTTSSDKWLDMMPTGVNKATALAVVLEHLGIDPADVVAFGDAENDVEMLQLVGCPVAKEGGAPSALASARYVTSDVVSSLACILDGLEPGVAVETFVSGV